LGTSREVLNVAKEKTAQPKVAAERPFRLLLPPHPIAAEQARALVRFASAEWGAHDVIDNVRLIAVELVTNALKIGEVFEIAISWQAGTVLVEVSDSSEAAPDRQRQSAERVDGRGLLLVEACSKDWGWRLEDRGGKTVWAIVDAPAVSALAPPTRM